MKPEYDFSKAERGKFYKPDTSFEFPIYLEPDVNEFLNKLAKMVVLNLSYLMNAKR